MNFLIVGCNFNNKGAQSMLFITIDEIKKEFKNAKVYCTETKRFSHEIYNFDYVYFSNISKKIALSNNLISYSILTIMATLKDSIKYILGKKVNLFKFYELKKIIKTIDVIIDISGFNIGDQWSTKIQESYINNIRIAKKYNIPIYLMPQSFGPFDNYKNRRKLLNEIKTYLKYPKKIFAREEDGYNKLTKDLKLKNVYLSYDLVLQNKSIDLNNIYNIKQEINLPKIKNKSVGIIPNIQCFNHGNKNIIIKSYIDIINYLLKKNKNIYLLRHSVEDIIICKEIKDKFINNNKVIMLENDFNCLEYDELVKNFDFIICSRFHGIVHAYKNFVPSIILSWAIKYKELAKNVNQEKYVYNIISDNIDINYILNMLDDMINNLNDNIKIIQNKVREIQNCNCFIEVFNDIKESK